ncbi:MAG: hypothetical protein PF442_12535 [Desulfobulbaceae bacterium]|nr:hypothetical protein [Desulfobulbaceae bacterium]
MTIDIHTFLPRLKTEVAAYIMAAIYVANVIPPRSNQTSSNS